MGAARYESFFDLVARPLSLTPVQAVIRDQGSSGIRDQGSGIRDQGSGIRDQGSGIRVQAVIREQGPGIGVQGPGRDQ
jgi:hypothetical protein